MATTIRELIEQLKDEGNLDQPIFYQYLLAEHTSLSRKKFEQALDNLPSGVWDDLSFSMESDLKEYGLGIE